MSKDSRFYLEPKGAYDFYDYVVEITAENDIIWHFVPEGDDANYFKGGNLNSSSMTGDWFLTQFPHEEIKPNPQGLMQDDPQIKIEDVKIRSQVTHLDIEIDFDDLDLLEIMTRICGLEELFETEVTHATFDKDKRATIHIKTGTGLGVDEVIKAFEHQLNNQGDK